MPDKYAIENNDDLISRSWLQSIEKAGHPNKVSLEMLHKQIKHNKMIDRINEKEIKKRESMSEKEIIIDLFFL